MIRSNAKGKGQQVTVAAPAETKRELPRANDRHGRGSGETPANGSTDAGTGRPSITITTEEHEVNAEAVAALGRDNGIYQRICQLVRVVRDRSPAAKGIRRPFGPRIDALPKALLRERLAAN